LMMRLSAAFTRRSLTAAAEPAGEGATEGAGEGVDESAEGAGAPSWSVRTAGAAGV